MKKITNPNNIEIGKKYLLREKQQDSFAYFIKDTVVKISNLDEGGDFWTDEFEKENLSENWKDYTSLCIGNPEYSNYEFYEIEE